MAPKNSLTINLTSPEIKEIISYCDLNNIDDVDTFVTSCFKQGLNIEMYGLLNDRSGKTGGIQEKRVEVQVEVIKEVEKIVEVPVEIIKYVDKEVIKEVFVPKIEYIRDESINEELILKIRDLENRKPEILETIKEIPVEKVVEVEKIVYSYDNTKLEMIQETLQSLRQELFEKNKKIKELETTINEFNTHVKNKPALYHRGSNLNDKLL